MGQQTQVVENRVFVTSGSTICPHPGWCDLSATETYEGYVRRHLEEHAVQVTDPDSGLTYDYFSGFGDDDTQTGLEAQERNLGVWCLFFYAKHIQGNKSLGTGAAIVADYEPCWEDAFFLSNNTFHPDDLEQNVDLNDRTFHLKPYAEQRHEGAIHKNKKKLTKVRGTQKTSWVKAFITWKHLRGYYIFRNPTLRVLCISANKSMARDNYYEPLKTLWDSNANIRRLYGTIEYTRRHAQLLARREAGKFVAEEDLRAEQRELGLLRHGSKSSVDRMRMRWNVLDKDASGQTAVSLCCAGANTGTQGGRWDIVVVDDIVDVKNSRTKTQRDKIIGVVAELRNQARGATAEVVYINTPQKPGDASELIDKNYGDEYHIMYRPAMWYDTATKEPHYYWQRSAPTDIFPEGEELWTPEQIDKKRKDPDFWSQIMLRLRQDGEKLFKREDFPIITLDSIAYPEVTAGLGGAPISERDAARIIREELSIRRVTFVDTAGDEERASGDDTACVTWGFDRYGSMYLLHIGGGRLNPTEEGDLVYDAWAYANPESVQIEVTQNNRKYVAATYNDMQRRKALELDQPITIPIVYVNAASTKFSKGERIDRMYTYTSTGRVFILSNAGSREKIDLFIEQFVDRGHAPHDDYADAGSRVTPYASRAPQRERAPDAQVAASQQTTEPSPPASARINIADILASFEGQDERLNWGAQR